MYIRNKLALVRYNLRCWNSLCTKFRKRPFPMKRGSIIREVILLGRGKPCP